MKVWDLKDTEARATVRATMDGEFQSFKHLDIDKFIKSQYLIMEQRHLSPKGLRVWWDYNPALGLHYIKKVSYGNGFIETFSIESH